METAPTPEFRASPQWMRLRYGFNEIDAWWHFSLGDHRERIRRRLRLMGTQVIRIFAFDKPVPDPVADWPHFAAYVQGVLDCGAVPMVTFAKYHPPHDDARNLRTYLARCRDIVWGCLEQWGESVRDWYWCVWNEPNNIPVGGGLSFPLYRRIYEETAGVILRELEPYLDRRKARIGGPAVDGFQPYWLDWIEGLVSEVDDALVGFVSWHRYGDWRPTLPSAMLGVDLNGSPDAPSGERYKALLLAQTPDYEGRARSVARLLAGRDILNVCGELNTVVHHDHRFVGGLNQDAFGGAYYASALIHLLRGGADLEMRWTATDNDDAYGLIARNGEATPTCLAKQLFAQQVRYGDRIHFPEVSDGGEIEAVASCDENGRCGAVFVHTGPGRCEQNVSARGELSACGHLLRVDEGTGRRVTCERFDGRIRFDGYGVAVVTNDETIELE